jgi:hypothetical protein
MRVLLLQPEDSPEQGPWSRQHWDLIVDLGKSSPFSEEKWSCQCGCPILRTDSFRHGGADARTVRQLFEPCRGRLIDEEGIDWWDLLAILVAPDALTLLALRSVAERLSPSAELWATRPGGVAGMLAVVLNRSIRDFGGSDLKRVIARAGRVAGIVRRFSLSEIKQIALDKYDPGYRWRSRFTDKRRGGGEPVILLPSAYENVSRTAAAYARLLPEQHFLLVAARQSAKEFTRPENVQVRDLADYANAESSATEIASLLERWAKLSAELKGLPEWRMLFQAGALDLFPEWIRDGLSTRNAWRGVLDRESVSGVLCGDDSNRYTRLPVLLAARRKIPTVDFHHGALDGWYLLKELPCDLYLAKSEMERDYLLRVCGLPADRVAIGAAAPPTSSQSVGVRTRKQRQDQPAPSVVFFSEPYEVAGMRSREVYREVLPPLCRVAREGGRGLVVKLHPFESLTQRSVVIREILAPEDRELVTVVDGPITNELMERAWFGVTVESTTVIDCLQNGVRCFLCTWLAHSPFDYVGQYARFGIGEVLQDAKQLLEIPERMTQPDNRSMMKSDLSATVDPAKLKAWLTRSHELPSVRSVS